MDRYRDGGGIVERMWDGGGVREEGILKKQEKSERYNQSKVR